MKTVLRGFAAVLLATILSWGATASASSVRLEFQGRVDAFNLFGGGDLALAVNGVPAGSVVPIVTPGVRFLDGELFVGLGFGYHSASVSECGNNGCADEEDIDEWSSWSLSPMVSWEFLNGDMGGLYLLGWFNFGELLDRTREEIRGNTRRITRDPGYFWWGANIGLGIRGELSKAVSLGVEFGWGVAAGDDDDPGDEDSAFVHGLWGILVLSAGIPL